MPNFNFDPNQHKLAEKPEPLPAGWYPAMIDSSEIVATAAKDGFRLVFIYKIIDGPGKGRTVRSGHNIENPSQQAVEISMSEIKTISTCVGIHVPINQTEELHNRPLQIRLTTPKDSDFNEVKGWKDINGQDAGKIAPQAPVAVPAQGFAQPVSQPGVQISPDGHYMFVNGAWVPNVQQAPPPPPPPPAQPAYTQQAAPTAVPAWAQPPAMPPAPSAQPAYATQQPPPPPPPAAPSWSAGAPVSAPAWASGK